MSSSKRIQERNVVAVIQARMGSTRLPGKVLADLDGRPVLQWVVEAVRKIALVDNVVVATTDLSEDAEIEEWCGNFGVECFRGDSEDVLKRYYDCASHYCATHVVRVTADCPLLDCDISQEVIRCGLDQQADYFYLAGEFPDGLDTEGITIRALASANKRASLRSEREHVTPFIRNRPDDFQVFPIELFDSYGQVRLCVDYKEDLDLLRKLIKTLKVSGSEVSTQNLLDLLLSDDRLRKINDSFARNSGYLASLAND